MRYGRFLNLDLMFEKEEGRTLPDEASPQRCSRGNVLVERWAPALWMTETLLAPVKLRTARTRGSW